MSQTVTEEQAFITEINAQAGEGDRFVEKVYADWLDEMGDPRAEAWRVLLEAGKRPELWFGEEWHWFKTMFFQRNERIESRLDDSLFLAYPRSYDGFETFFDAMNAAAIAWVRANRDEDFMGCQT